MRTILLKITLSRDQGVTAKTIKEQILDDFIDIGIEGDVAIISEFVAEETSNGEATESHSQTEET